MAAHGAPYVAQLAPNKWPIMAKGFQKALETEGLVLSILFQLVLLNGSLTQKIQSM